MGAKRDPTGNVANDWHENLKPKVLQYKRVPLEIVAEVLGFTSTDPVKAMLRTNMYSFGCARPGTDGNIYEVYPMRFVAWYEGVMQ